MLISFLRTLVIYVFIAASLRLMGKRQVGELQPTELCITILISAVASVPMQDMELPLAQGLVPILTLIAAEIVVSALCLKSPPLRKLLSGNSITVIRRGKVDRLALIKLRMTLDDLFEDLRLKDVYDIRTVRLAQVETNGKLSVLLNEKDSPPSREDLNLKLRESGPFYTLICDGKEEPEALKKLGYNDAWLYKTLKKNGVSSAGDVFYLLSDGKGNEIFMKKDGKA